MFGYVTASWKELTAEEQKRYGAVYCGICREIRQRSTGIGRICLSYDMAFLALLLMSLYEPEEESGKKACPPERTAHTTPSAAHAASRHIGHPMRSTSRNSEVR